MVNKILYVCMAFTLCIWQAHSESLSFFRIGTISADTNLYRHITNLGTAITENNKQDEKLLIVSSVSYSNFKDAMLALSRREIESVAVPISIARSALKKDVKYGYLGPHEETKIIAPLGALSFLFFTKQNLSLAANAKIRDGQLYLGKKDSVQEQLSKEILDDLRIGYDTLSSRDVSHNEALSLLEKGQIDVASIMDFDITNYAKSAREIGVDYMQFSVDDIVQFRRKHPVLSTNNIRFDDVFFQTISVPIVWITNVKDDHASLKKITNFIWKSEKGRRKYIDYVWHSFYYSKRKTIFGLPLHNLVFESFSQR